MIYMKKYIPNCLSILNLFCGVIGTVLALKGQLIHASCAVFTGAIFDFLDGFTAKLLDAQSKMGKQLDSLVDLISFGMLPAAIMYMLIQIYETCPFRPYAALCVVTFSALRLAKFNIDNRQTHQFIGMPVPANALFIATLPMLIKRNIYPKLVAFLTQPLMLPILAIVLSFLLVSSIKFIALKFRGYSLWHNIPQYMLILLSICSITCMNVEGIFVAICLYIFLSIVYNFHQPKQ